jgi:hypothetical protein
MDFMSLVARTVLFGSQQAGDDSSLVLPFNFTWLNDDAFMEM